MEKQLKVNNELNLKRWLESDAYAKQKAVIFKEINDHPLVIDYTVFKKSPQERALLATLKEAWEKEQNLLKKVA